LGPALQSSKFKQWRMKMAKSLDYNQSLNSMVD